MLTVACVNVGNYEGRGEEYVKILRDMVIRNLGRPFRFVCLTDTPIAGIECHAPKPGLEGWWAKLYLFTLLKDDVLYFDLDTIITGPLEFLADCEERFAILRDFYRWNGQQSAVMRWRGDHSYVWDQWIAAGRPRMIGGDQTWIEKVLPDAKRLQDLYPERFCSYKRDAIDWIPSSNTSVVCFHGRPRPHEVTDRWVPHFWKIGGIGQPRFIKGLNTAPEVLLAQMEANIDRDTPLFVEVEAHSGKALICGGGPSLKDELPNLRRRIDRGGHVFATNGTYDWLVERGIRPHFHVLLDARPDNIQFVKNPHKNTVYLIASQCHPSIFEALEGYSVIQWVNWHPGVEELCNRNDKPLTIVCSGNTVGLQTMCLTSLWGYRSLHLYGFDSCYRGEANHAYPQPLNDGEARLDITVKGDGSGKVFHCARWMAKQAMDFEAILPMLMQMGVNVTVHGDGLISHIISLRDTETERVDVV